MWMRSRLALSLTLGLAATLSMAVPGCVRTEQETQSPAASDESSDVSGEIGSAVTEAQAVLAAGLAEARRTDRLVFLHSGAPWCGWCRRLELWLQREDMPYCYVVYTNYQSGTLEVVSPKDPGMTRERFIDAMIASASMPICCSRCSNPIGRPRRS